MREATAERGLLNLRTTPDALAYFLDEKNIALFRRHNVFTRAEMRARYEIMLDNYVKTVKIESNVMLDMVRREFLPAICEYAKEVCDTAASKRALSSAISTGYEVRLAEKLSSLTEKIADASDELDAVSDEVFGETKDTTEAANGVRDRVIPAMERLRVWCDEAEKATAAKYIPYPTYAELLFGVR